MKITLTKPEANKILSRWIDRAFPGIGRVKSVSEFYGTWEFEVNNEPEQPAPQITAAPDGEAGEIIASVSANEIEAAERDIPL